MIAKSILYIGAFELPDKNAAAHRVVANGKLLKQLGFDVYYLGFDKQVKNDTPICETKQLVGDFVSYSLHTPSSLKESLHYLMDIGPIEHVVKNEMPEMPAIIIAYNYPFLALSRLRKFCSKNNIKLVSDCTEWYYNPKGNLPYRLLKILDMYFRMHIIHPKLDGVIAVSKYLFEYYKGKIRNIVYVPPLIDMADDKWKKEHVPADDTYTLVYAGSPGRQGKDRLDKIISALVTLQEKEAINLKLIVVGVNREQYIALFGENVLPPGADNFVIFKGRISHQASLDELKKADYMIFLRDKTLANKTGFPTKFVEAFGCGVPVLTNESSNILDYLEDGKNGYVLNMDTERSLIASLLPAFSASKSEISEMKERVMHQGFFDYRNYVQSFKSFIEKL